MQLVPLVSCHLHVPPCIERAAILFVATLSVVCLLDVLC